MILSVRINNFMAYEGAAELSLLARDEIKKFGSNVFKCGKIKALKSACVYGANNAGKTCMLSAIAAIKNVLNDNYEKIIPNAFSDNSVCSLGISFLSGETAYTYDFAFDCKCGRKVIRERFALMGGEDLFLREGKTFTLNSKRLEGDFSDEKVFIYALPEPLVKTYKDVLLGFRDNIDVLTLDNIPIEKTICTLKQNSLLKEKTIKLIRLADIDVDDYRYLEGATENNSPNELALKEKNDILNLNSFKGDKPLNFIYDSTGTKKLIALSSYIVEALIGGRVLVVDELDSSLHFKLTRAIVALFNNELSSAQLIFSAHDINLLDCKKLLRYDQVWFSAKKDGSAVLYPLVKLMEGRSDTDVIEGYKTGLYGALPNPDFITLLLKEIKDDDEE